MSIFVSIAAYRDPQLVPTIADCLAKARYPEQVRFGICRQHGSEEGPLSLPDRARVDLIDVDWHESRGACWARAEIMRMWDGEDYFLQLDSHHRFAPDWDAKLIDHMHRTGSPKPILSTYGTPFTPGAEEHLEHEAMRMVFDYFTPHAIALFRPAVIPNWRQLTRPVRARFVSAHFLFTIGEFVKEVPYDPELYFIGEEISMAVRAFTNGYDLFHPPEPIVWHEYTRAYRPKHWEDHVKERGVAVEWHQREGPSVDKVEQLLTAPTIGPLALGTVRSLADYEAHAGLSFRSRRAQDYTCRGDEPPNPPAPLDWAEGIRPWRIVATLDRATLPSPALDDAEFWYVGAHDADGAELYREDLLGEELSYLLAGNTPQIVIERQFDSYHEPLTWTVWPFSRGAGWLDKIEGTVDRSPLPPRRQAISAARRAAAKRAIVDLLAAGFPPIPRLPASLTKQPPGLRR